jgi:hypothetical protein
MKKLVYIVLLFIVCTCSRGKINSPTDHYIYLSDPGDMKMSDSKGSDLFSEINLIPLKENADFLIGSADKFIKCDSFFYILDKDKTKSIYKYDHKGNPVKRFLHKGGSGEEYAEIIDFDIDQLNKEILIFCVPPKILYTDTDFNNIGKNNNLGYDYYDRIVSWKNNVFLYNHRDRKVAYLNPETGKPEECLHTRKMEAYLIPPESTAFFKTRNNLYFQAPGDDCIYKLQNNRFIPFITMDYKKKEASMKFYEETYPSDVTPSSAMEHSVPTVYSIRERDDQLIIVYVHNFVFRVCTYNISQKTYKDQIKHCFSEYYGFYFDNAVYGVQNPVDLKVFKMPEFHEFMKGVKYDFTDLALDEDFENPVIVEHILK